MSGPTLEAVRAALSDVVDPVFDKSLLALDLVSDLHVEGDRARMRVRLSTASDRIRSQIQADTERVLAGLGVQQVGIDWDVQIPMRPTGPDDPVPDVRNVVLVMSGKGGVGKSSCAVNLAMALARAGTRVGLLDADIYGPSLPTMLGVSGSPKSLDGKTIEPLERFGMKLMSIGFLTEDPKSAIVWRGPMLQGALQQFLKDVNWGHLDYLLIDMPPGTGDVALTLAQRLKATGAVVITTPQEVALQDVYKSVSMCQKLNIPLLGVVENMSYFVDSAGVKQTLFGSGGGEKVAAFAGAPLLGSIPLDPLVRQWADDGTPVVQADPTSSVAQAFSGVADDLATRISALHFARGGGEKAPATEGQRRLKIIR